MAGNNLIGCHDAKHRGQEAGRPGALHAPSTGTRTRHTVDAIAPVSRSASAAPATHLAAAGGERARHAKQHALLAGKQLLQADRLQGRVRCTSTQLDRNMSWGFPQRAPTFWTALPALLARSGPSLMRAVRLAAATRNRGTCPAKVGPQAGDSCRTAGSCWGQRGDTWLTTLLCTRPSP